MASTPYCAALVLAEHTYKDHAGQWHILGTSNAFVCLKFPARIAVGVFCVLSDGVGDFIFRLRIVEADHPNKDGEEVCSIEMNLPLVNPLEDFTFGGDIATEIKKPGTYFVEAWVNDEMLMARRLQVILEKSP